MKISTITALLLLLTFSSISVANVPMELNVNCGVGLDGTQHYQSNVFSSPSPAPDGSGIRQIPNTRANDDTLYSILKMFWDGVVRTISGMSTLQMIYLVAIIVGFTLLITIVYIGGQMGIRRTAIFYAGRGDYCLVVACWLFSILLIFIRHHDETHYSEQEIIGILCAIFQFH